MRRHSPPLPASWNPFRPSRKNSLRKLLPRPGHSGNDRGVRQHRSIFVRRAPSGAKAAQPSQHIVAADEFFNGWPWRSTSLERANGGAILANRHFNRRRIGQCADGWLITTSAGCNSPACSQFKAWPWALLARSLSGSDQPALRAFNLCSQMNKLMRKTKRSSSQGLLRPGGSRKKQSKSGRQYRKTRSREGDFSADGFGGPLYSSAQAGF